MTELDFKKILLHIVSKSVELKNKYTNEITAKIEFCDIFSKDDEEYRQLTSIINKIGRVVYSTESGKIYKLIKPIRTIAGDLFLVKIRIPDNKFNLRGDADFDTNYKKFKQVYKNSLHFELIVREKFEMLRLSDPDFDVMSCFSNIPVRKWI
jgi:hypothetical protein